MEKRISTGDLAAIKRTALNIARNLAKRNKAKAEIKKWTEEYERQEKIILNYEKGIIEEFGLRCEQVVVKEKGQPKYILKDNVRFDSDARQYVVTIADESDNEAAPIENENHIETASCDCEEQALQEADEPDENIVNATTDVVEVQQEEQNETAQPEVELQEAFDEDMFKY